jgi:lantibiotic modifying enzyme
MGNLELLMQTAIETGDSAAASQWRAIAAQLLSEGRSYWRTGSIRNDQSLGFMTGLSGIGYTLLRINDPYNVPAVVSLQLQGRPLADATGTTDSATHAASADWVSQWR